MTTASAVLGIVPGLQATALLGHNIKFMKDSIKLTKKKTVSIKPTKAIKVGVATLVGISLIKPTAQMINVL